MLFRFLLAAAIGAAQEPAEKPKQVVVVTGTFDAIPLEEAERSVRSIPARELAPVTATISDLLNLDASLTCANARRAPFKVDSRFEVDRSARPWCCGTDCG